MRLLRWLVFYLCCVVSPAIAGPAEDAAAADHRGDYTTAARLWRSLADQGSAQAQFNLATLYQDGKGVPLDNVQATHWYRRAANQGHQASQWQLGLMHAEGRIVSQDYVQAHMWLNLVAAGLPASDQSNRRTAIAERDRLATKMTPEQIAEAQRLAREWKPMPGAK